MFGLSKKGFKRKRYADIRADLVKRWKDAFGENSRTEEKSINGILISLIAYTASPIWMLAEKVYNSGFVHKAEGDALSNIVRNNMLKRRPAEKASGKIEISGDEGTEVEAGFRVSSKYEFVTTETVEIGESGTVMSAIEAVIAGADSNCASKAIDTIDTPIVGVDEVTNPEPISGGRDAETDEELKQRYELSRSSGGSPSTNGIRAEVLGVEGVRTATVIENLELEEDDEGRPGRSYETYVLGGSDEDIAKAIFKRRAAGTQPYGSTTVDVKDDAGNKIPISFTRATEIEIYFSIELDTDEDFPEDGHSQIRTSIISYVGGMDADGNVYTGLQTGQDMHFTKVISLIHKIPGVISVKAMEAGTSESDLESFKDVEIQRIEVAMTDYEKIDIS